MMNCKFFEGGVPGQGEWGVTVFLPVPQDEDPSIVIASIF